jgi:carboxyl-terminal processing protease
VLLGVAPIASRAAAAPIASRAAAPPYAISAYDLIELQISYTTLLARFYRPLAPRVLVDGARTGIAAELLAHGIANAALPYTPARVSFDDGADAIDTMVLRTYGRYRDRLDGHRLVEAAVAGELAALHDPYSVLFHPQQFAKFNAFLGNDAFGGIGAVLSYDAAQQRADIDRVLPGSPAERAGIVAGDAIRTIDGRAAAGLGGQGLRDALRGKIGTPVRVEVVHADGTSAAYVLVRAALHDPEVQAQLLGEVGYLRLTRFGADAGREVDAALDDLRARGARATVLDLRANGGGYGDEATAVASAFIPSGTIYTVRERGGATTVARATGSTHARGPLALLVDGDTASAAEIVAGAVQDAGAGRVFGTRTFGKGLVQSVFPLPDGSAFKLTTARYTTPKGRDLDRVGVSPDISVAEPPGAREGDPATDPQLAAALDWLRTALAQGSPGRESGSEGASGRESGIQQSYAPDRPIVAHRAARDLAAPRPCADVGGHQPYPAGAL